MMPERTVKAVLASYRDADGVLRHALRGEVVDVHPDDADDDRLFEQKPAAKKAAPAKKTRG
jgi:hypothetical protein